MAHSHMDHGDMGHGDMDHDMPMPMCSMNMLFTWKTENLCIIFESWRVTGLWSLIVTLFGIMVLTAGYEAVRDASRRYEQRQAIVLESMPRNAVADQEGKGKVAKAAFYAVQVFYSFFIMLLFMTYNGWVMIAVGVGAFIGYLLFSGSSASKSAACH
ncbi:related to a putative low-affinity copper transport protein [Ramularia collo-cygni]|uniref:Copper transport protein n=1 Tax=Ramularia collo-cygni TaxID=112498 RepID=A0A2D3UYI7_9PEZI|nr:related to a putative low-affinity copper transport protein [Ramularia collo-cygni]CZT19435.1 related to a putative low-affinity copper transport protein [Ramularia collo-cygni]